MRSIRSEQGSSVLEFVILVPLFLVIMLGGFTQIHQTQMRQLAVTSLARELSRAIELGQSPRHLNETLANLRIDLGLSESPTLKLEAMSVDTAWLRVHYKGQLFQTQLSLEGADPGWKRALRSDLGSMLPLSLGFFCLTRFDLRTSRELWVCSGRRFSRQPVGSAVGDRRCTAT